MIGVKSLGQRQLKDLFSTHLLSNQGDTSLFTPTWDMNQNVMDGYNGNVGGDEKMVSQQQINDKTNVMYNDNQQLYDDEKLLYVNDDKNVEEKNGGNTNNGGAMTELITEEPIKDGFRWRKYGQKSVKGSPYPRSYYRCTVVDCKAKKHVEKFKDDNGSVKLRTIFIGEHIHPAPLFNRIFANDQQNFKNSVLAFFNSTEQEYVPETNNNSKGRGKRRKREDVVRKLEVECSNNINVLDDGYHWRKYGQKKVKGTPFPRAYYRCTHTLTKCSVRKMTEETQSGTFLISYEGTHNHVPEEYEEQTNNNLNISYIPMYYTQQPRL